MLATALGFAVVLAAGAALLSFLRSRPAEGWTSYGPLFYGRPSPGGTAGVFASPADPLPLVTRPLPQPNLRLNRTCALGRVAKRRAPPRRLRARGSRPLVSPG